MELGTDFVSPDKRITENDFRSGKLWTERPDESAAGDGWTWVAALLVAALFIVSGYLDQESASTASSASGAAGTYTASAGPHSSIASAAAADRQSDKGY